MECGLITSAIKLGRSAEFFLGGRGRIERISGKINLAECFARVVALVGALLTRNAEIVGRDCKLYAPAELDD